MHSLRGDTLHRIRIHGKTCSHLPLTGCSAGRHQDQDLAALTPVCAGRMGISLKQGQTDQRDRQPDLPGGSGGASGPAGFAEHLLALPAPELMMPSTSKAGQECLSPAHGIWETGLRDQLTFYYEQRNLSEVLLCCALSRRVRLVDLETQSRPGLRVARIPAPGASDG